MQANHEEGDPRSISKCTARIVLVAFGWLNVVLGMIGAVLPGMPTTVFLLIALWAFSRSSERFQLWLWNHPRFGSSLRAWRLHRVIPLKAKIMAASMMTASFGYITMFVAQTWVLPAFMASIMIPAGAYVCSRAGTAPRPAAESQT